MHVVERHAAFPQFDHDGTPSESFDQFVQSNPGTPNIGGGGQGAFGQAGSNGSATAPRQNNPLAVRPFREVVEVVARFVFCPTGQVCFGDGAGEPVIPRLSASEDEQVFVGITPQG